jgi:hypothetical protein
MTIEQREATAEMIACSDAITAAITPLLTEHDSRILFACLAAELAYVGALLRAAGVYQPTVVGRVLAEAMVTALTLDTKAPKILYTDGGEPVGTKQ